MSDESFEQLPAARPVFTWPGGKRRMLKYILPLIPAHAIYCEPFGGGLAVFAAKARSEVEVVNDINGDLVSFYRCCKFHLDALLDEMDLVLNSRQEIDDYREQRGLTEIQRAARFCVINVLSFGGTMTGFRVTRTSSLPSRAQRLLAIRALNHRLDRTTIEHLSWEKCLAIYDRADGFFFLDPPYLAAGGEAYAGWSEHELARFGERVKTLQARWMVTFQDCSQIRDVFAGYKMKTIERANGIGNNGHKPKGRVYREVIVTSDPAQPVRQRRGASA